MKTGKIFFSKHKQMSYFQNRTPMYENIKSCMSVLLASLMATISPILPVIIILLATFVFNIFTGIAADVWGENKKFDIKKAFTAFFQMAFLMAFVYYLYNVFDILKLNDIAEQSIKWISVLAIYFYSTNIMRNVCIVFPGNKFFAFLYEVLSTQIFVRIKRALMLDIKGNQND